MRLANLIFLCVAVLLAAGAGRLAYLEHHSGPALRDKAQRQRSATFRISAQRGEIIDTRGRVLAGSIRRPSIFVDPSNVDDPKFAAYSMAPLLGLSAVELERMLRERAADRFVWVKREISQDELVAFEAQRKARRLFAFGVQEEPRRTYPLGRVAAHVLGFVGADERGLAGIEQQCEKLLAGRDGTRTAIVDVQRRRLQASAADYVAPQDGATVVLTIDAYIQQRAEEHLRNAVKACNARWGVAVVMDPQTGEVLAMATAPDFDPQKPLKGVSGPVSLAAGNEILRNRAISDAFEPGSIFKPFIASLALQDNLVRLDEVFQISGPTRQFGPRTIHDTKTHDALDVSMIVANSSNIGMAMIGERCTNVRLNRYVRRFGFGDPTGIMLPGEHSGLVQDFSRWGPYSTQSIPIGQEIAATPIQLITAFAAIANGGVLYRPRIIRGLADAAGRPIADYSRPIPVRRVLDEEVARRFRDDALVKVINSGTGGKAALLDYQAFGKTGTAEVAKEGGGGYIPRAYTGSMLVGAPASNPRAVVLVSIRTHNQRLYYGGTVAAPAARDILADTLAYMQTPHDRMSDAPAALPEVGGD